ncbi:AAA domain-containing protein [Actinocorallia herbida]|uniref:Nuclease SbcCD subunit C n=1 Tax=Actinocorallia herbida TaxID=58109 RepID=A0A3N1CT62_9ACTN|nr:AAA family ATPase [Actinocorallia herbida]ROO84501.1 AAA domain-containing protein [Actinocorallia herbida]
MALRDVLAARLEESGLEGGAAARILETFDAQGETARGGGGAARAYLESVTVAGFRGIGRETTLPLRPAPGLTLVVGRNGSGKSSFAEGAEIALTGTNSRWSDLPAAWRDGWRNLHADGAPAVTVGLRLDGRSDTVRVRRSWPGRALDGSVVEVSGGPGAAEGLDGLGWGEDLTVCRPFLSYAELGKILTGRPKDMHDAIAGILGLERLAATEAALDAERKTLETAAKESARDRTALLADLEAVADPRAGRASDALRARVPDVGALAGLVTAGTPVGDLAPLRRLAALTPPGAVAVADAVRELREVAAAPRAAVSDAEARLADLLERALPHQGADRCPVCRSAAHLDEDWARETRAEIGALRERAAETLALRERTTRAVAAARALIERPPADLPAELLAPWKGWASGRSIDGPAELADHLDAHAGPFARACAAAAASAEAELAALDDLWRPLALRLAAWTARERDVQAAAPELARLKAARAWLTKTANALRTEELRPMAETASAIWEQLRQESNVSLGAVTLAGTGTMKRVELDVAVDGSETSALGVMSQGELHSLALALFLPRVMAARTPFGFVLIDDPVQSMDPAKVDGLAKVLDSVARHRQVVVFTHDTRLRDAVARLRLPASVLEVTRGERSAVAVRPVEDEVSRALADARAVAATVDLPQQTAATVVAGLCRTALEAACVQVVHRKLLERGWAHSAVDARVRASRSLGEIASLALFGEKKPREAFNAEAAPEIRAAIGFCNRGVHGTPFTGDLSEAISLVNRAARTVRSDW